MVLTIAAVAEAKGITLTGLSSQVQMQVNQTPGQTAFTRFTTEVHLDGTLSERERAILFNSARRCEVHRLLQGEVEFVEKLVVG